MDAHENEDSSSTLRENRLLTNFTNFVALICCVNDSVTSSIQEAYNQQGWKDSCEKDDVCIIVPGLWGEPILGGCSGNTFLAKRECLCM